MVSLVGSCCPWLVLAPKVLQLCTNHLVLVLCRSMWVSEACQLFLVPSQSSSMPLYPSRVLWARERAPTPYSSVVFCLGFIFESLKELGMCQLWLVIRPSIHLFRIVHSTFTSTLRFHLGFIHPLAFSLLMCECGHKLDTFSTHLICCLFRG